MIDAATRKTLQDLVRRESRSLLLYLGEMFPWVPPDRQDDAERLQLVVREDGETIAELSRFLMRHRASPPFPAAYPMSFTGLGFVALDQVAARLVELQRQSIAALEADLGHIADSEAHGLVDKLLRRKRRHLTILESIASAPASSTVR